MRKFRACRINGTCYLEEFEDNRATRLVATVTEEEKALWTERYDEFVRLANFLNEGKASVFEVSYNNQREPENFGLYATKEKALRFLERLGVTEITWVGPETTHLGDYVITERIVG